MPQVRDLPSDLPLGKGEEPESWPGERRRGWAPSWGTAVPQGGRRPRLASAGCPENRLRPGTLSLGGGKGETRVQPAASHKKSRSPRPVRYFPPPIEGLRLGRSLAGCAWLAGPCCLALVGGTCARRAVQNGRWFAGTTFARCFFPLKPNPVRLPARRGFPQPRCRCRRTAGAPSVRKGEWPGGLARGPS